MDSFSFIFIYVFCEYIRILHASNSCILCEVLTESKMHATCCLHFLMSKLNELPLLQWSSAFLYRKVLINIL